MANYPYDPHRPPYPPQFAPSPSFSSYQPQHPDPSYAGYFPQYPPPAGYPSEPPPRPALYPSPSGQIHYPLPPQPSHPSPHYSPSPSYNSIQYPPPPPPPSYQPYHHQASFNPAELRFPPPHSDSFLQTYGEGPAVAHEPPPLYPRLDHMPSNVSISEAPPPYPRLDHMLSNVSISEPPPAPRPTSVPSFGGSSFQRPPPGHSGQLVPFKPGKSSLKVLLLHGNLDVWVHSAARLPNLDMFSNTFANLMGSKKDTSDPYVTISAGSGVLGRTFVRDNQENPVWDQHFLVPIAHRIAKITFTVKDDDFVGSQVIGVVDIHAEEICTGAKVEGSYPILSNGKPHKNGASLKLSIQYVPIEMLDMYHHGIESGPNYIGVPGTYFPLRKGGEVRLYQDAHVPDDSLPKIQMGHGMHYEHGKCWYDICKAISDARHLVYITGWSVYHNVRLVRDAAGDSGRTLGELLRSKSQEGLRILLLVWDDPTSRSILGFQKDGIMDTHDEETRRFFKHSSVKVLLCPRSAGKRHSWVKKQEAGFIFTHHQKSVIVDADAGNNRRKIIAFIGGLDLCKGRYDSPTHSLFRTLETFHKDDYHNPNFAGPNDGGPREPWHDLHCRIDGPAAFDVLTNFEERWLKASKRNGIKKLSRYEEDTLLKIERINSIIGIDESINLHNYGSETWHVQIFRSIDSNSVKGFPKESREVLRKNLVYGKNVLIDMSIHTAYVKAIRSAQHFIYIENQYFLGSSYNWSQHKDLGANNLVPMEIALKIANKIKCKERFSVYIVVPMWPEGIPTGNATQQILYWQHNTMNMMYETIYEALVEAGLEHQFSPEDYLNFFCLGNREGPDGKYSSEKTGEGSTPHARAQKNRRFMIYVHSKGMIVDDEYVIMGSANINQRSLEGTRDSEIAMGAYEPQHTWSRIPSGPRGQIYAYRMSLWAEHIGSVEACFNSPQSLECTRWIKMRAEENWNKFAAPQVTELSGHLLKYPVAIDRKGKVSALPGCDSFPDVGGKICGTFLGIQENLTI